MTTFTGFAVRFTTVNRTDHVVAQEKNFKTEAARAAFLDRMDERGALVEVLAFSDPS